MKMHDITKTAGMGAMVLMATFAHAKQSTQAKQCYADAHTAYQVLMARHTQEQNAKARININTADASAFLGLQGVGVRTAEAIVAYRKQVGRFDSVDDLMKVKGVGKAVLDKNRHRLVVAQ